MYYMHAETHSNVKDNNDGNNKNTSQSEIQQLYVVNYSSSSSSPMT